MQTEGKKKEGDKKKKEEETNKGHAEVFTNIKSAEGQYRKLVSRVSKLRVTLIEVAFFLRFPLFFSKSF